MGSGRVGSGRVGWGGRLGVPCLQQAAFFAHAAVSGIPLKLGPSRCASRSSSASRRRAPRSPPAHFSSSRAGQSCAHARTHARTHAHTRKRARVRWQDVERHGVRRVEVAQGGARPGRPLPEEGGAQCRHKPQAAFPARPLTLFIGRHFRGWALIASLTGVGEAG